MAGAASARRHRRRSWSRSASTLRSSPSRRLPPRGGPGAGRRRGPHPGREAARRRPRRGDAARRGIRGRRVWSNAVGHIERCNPALRAHARPARAGRARRHLPGRHPPTGPVPQPHRRRRGRQGPRHPRHRPDGLGDPVAVRRGVRPDRPQERPRARGPGLGHGADGGRHRGQPPGQLALAAQGAGHRGDRRAWRLRRRHPARRPDVPRERAGRHRVGPGGLVPRGHRGQQHPVRDPEAGAAARPARGVPRRRARAVEAEIVTMREGLAAVAVADACLTSARETPDRRGSRS